MSPADLLDLIAERAPKLRAAGVTSLTIDGVFACEFAPDQVQPPANAETPTEDEEIDGDPLNDAATFGLKPGAKLPGFDLPSRRTTAPAPRKRAKDDDDDC